MLYLPQNDDNNDHTDSKGGNQDAESEDFLLEGGQFGGRLASKFGNSPKDSAVAGSHGNANAASRDTVSTL